MHAYAELRCACVHGHRHVERHLGGRSAAFGISILGGEGGAFVAGA